MHEYKIEVERDGRWWMIHVPEIGQLTQARRITEIVSMAESLIHISTEIPLTEIKVNVANICVDGVNVLPEAAHVIDLRNQAARAEHEAQQAIREYVNHLDKAGVPVRDIATLVDLSPQRISQVTAK